MRRALWEAAAITRTEFSIFLMPAEPLRSTLRALIARLAGEYEAAPFEPHVTLFCGASREEEARACAHALAGRFGPLELAAERIDGTPVFVKTLFVQFAEQPIARAMSDEARAAYAPQSTYAFDPHLSLLYKTLSDGRRRKLIETVDAPLGAYLFDRLRLVETELPINDTGPIRRWRTVCDLPLAAG